MFNTIRHYAEHMNRNSGFPAFGVIALCVKNFCVCSITLKPLDIFSWNFIETFYTIRRHAEHMNRYSGFPIFWSYCPLCVNNFCVCSISLKPLDILSWNFTQMLTMRRHAEHMNHTSGYTPRIRSMHAMGYIVFFFVCASVNNFCVRSITLKRLDIFSWNLTQMLAPWDDMQNTWTVTLVFLLLELLPFEYWKWPFPPYTCVRCIS